MGYFDRQLSRNDNTIQEQNEQIGLFSQLAMTSSNLAYYMRTYAAIGDIEYFKSYWELKQSPKRQAGLIKSYGGT